MTFLADLFRRKPELTSSDSGSSDSRRDVLVQGLQLAAGHFYAAVVETLRLPGHGGERRLDASIAHGVLGGDALTAIRAYELLDVSATLSVCQYLPQSRGRDFTAEFFSRLCSSGYSEALNRAEVYRSMKDRDSVDARFAQEVASYILGMTPTQVMPGMFLASRVAIPSALPAFRCQIGLATAIAFGDERRAEDFRAQFRQQQAHGLISR
jgi:hypothetical protein